MGCKECGKPKCNGECGCKSPKVLQINNPAEYITFHKVSIPAAMGDSTTNPPKIGAYRNALVYYEADHTSWMYSTDGIPTLVTGEQGPTGPQGPAGTIAIGTTTTGETGSDAEVENVGTPENAILNFTIPKGDKGDQGVPGPQGYMNEQDVRDVVDTIVPEGFFDDEATVSGCGTEFELENLAGGEPVSVRINGDTFQQSYAGKNLCGGTLAQLKNRNPSGTWNGNQYFQSGITWTVYENADGTIDRIEASGQATENGKTFYIESFNRQQFEEQLGSEETYTLSGCPQGGSGGYYVRVASIPWKSMLTDRGSAATGTLIPSDNYNSVFVILGIDTSAGQVNNLVFRPQLELGSTATSYEPYVGGTPSPNPDYPQTIQTVTGEQTVEVVGKNLIDPSQAVLGTIDASTGDIVPWSGNTNMAGQEYIPVKPNTAYTLSVNSSWYFLRLSEYTADKANIQRTQAASSTYLTITTTANTHYLRWSANPKGAAITNPTAMVNSGKMQLELGSTATTYTPYSKQTYPINLGKNLIDMSQTWVRGTLNNSSVDVQPNNNTILSDYIKVEPNTTYVFSQKQLGGKEVKPNVVSFFKDKVNVRTGFVAILNSSPQAFTTSNDTCYIRVGYYNSTGLTLDTWLDYVTDLQLEVGSTATTYAPYITPIELCKLGTYQDYIWKDGEDWKVHKATSKVTLTGAETWQHANVGSAATFFQLSETNWNAAFGANTEPVHAASASVVATSAFLSERLRSIDATDTNMKLEEGIGKKGTWFRISLLNSRNVSTTAQLQTWLSNNNIPVNYALEAPTDTTITNSTLIAQLEAIRLDAGVNAISVSSDGLSGEICLEAYRDNWEGTIAGIDNNFSQIESNISEIESSVADHETRITANEQAIASLEAAKNGLIAISREQGTDDYWLMYSPDGEHFYQCGEMLPNGIGRDASSLTEINGRYYYVYSGGYRITTDFKNWSQGYAIPNDQTDGRRVWANTLYYDEENEIVYIYSAYQYNDDEIMPDIGAMTHYFKIVYQTATINSDGTLSVDATTQDLIYDEGESYIDPYVSMDYNLGLVIAYKDELRTTILTRTMNTPTSVNNDAIETPVTGIEAPQLVSTPLGTICYFDGYKIGSKVVTTDGTQGAADCCGFFYVSNRGSWYNHKSRGVVPIKTSCPLRHPGIMECSDKALALVQQLGVHPYPTSGSKSVGSSLRDGMKNVTAKDGELVVNLQGLCYIMGGTKTVTIKPELKQEPFRFFFYKGATITWSEDSNIQSFMKGGTFTADHDQWMTLYPDSRDMVGGLYVPIDRS